MKTSFQKFMASSAVNPVKVELATIEDNLTKIQAMVNQHDKVITKGTNEIRAFISQVKSLKMDKAVIQELIRQQKQLKDLGVPPNAKIDFTIENAEIFEDLVKKILDILPKYISSVQGYDI